MSDRAPSHPGAAPGEVFDRLLEAFLDHEQETLEELARDGIDVDLRDPHGHTVLQRAAARGETAAVEWILQAGAEVDAGNTGADLTARTAFLLAAGNGHLEIAETLLTAGANPNQVDSHGLSALMLAGANGHLEAVRFLVRSGVDLDLETQQKETALTLAQRAGHGEIVALLEALGAAPGSPTEALPGLSPPPPIAEREWQTPPVPGLPEKRPLRPFAGMTSDGIAEFIDDQISDWIEDEIDL